MEILSHLTFVSVLTTLVMGLIVGLLARVLKPGDDNMSLVMTTIMGILGSFLAKWVGQQFGWVAQGHFSAWAASVVATMVLLVIYSLIFRRKTGII